MNFLSMAGVRRKGHITQLLDRLPDTRNANNTENWEGEPGGRGIRALTRYLDTYTAIRTDLNSTNFYFYVVQ